MLWIRGFVAWGLGFPVRGFNVRDVGFGGFTFVIRGFHGSGLGFYGSGFSRFIVSRTWFRVLGFTVQGFEVCGFRVSWFQV